MCRVQDCIRSFTALPVVRRLYGDRCVKLIFEEQFSDSPYVERIWRSQCPDPGVFTSVALSHWQMSIWKYGDRMKLTVRGPETAATSVPCPEHDEFIGIVFKLGTFMPLIPASSLVNGAMTLPEGVGQSFHLNGDSWQFPTYENVDTFVDRLVRDGLLVKEPVVDSVLHNQPQDLSLRSVQRRYLRATGITHSTAFQIERARYATLLLRQGVPILDVVDRAGYADQPHLTRALKQYMAQTPAQILNEPTAQTMSFLFKTALFE